MVLAVVYDKSSGKILKVNKSNSKTMLSYRAIGSAIVSKCPTETYNMTTTEMRKQLRVKHENNGFVELEYGK
jgi:hypothetical protein